MKLKIEITYMTPKGTEAVLFSETLPASQALLLAEDLEKTGRVKQLQFVDMQQISWTMKEIKKLLKEVESEPHEITLYFDGGFDKTKHEAGLGIVIYYQQNERSYRLRVNARDAYSVSNNEAEYAALHFGLQELEHLGAANQEITITGDSQVVINQLNGEWPVIEEGLTKWADKIDQQLSKLGLLPYYEQIPRNQNKEADQLASQALNGQEIRATIVRTE